MTSALPSLSLTCFGSPQARVDGSDPPADVAWRKHMALLIYLALSPDLTRSRDHLLGLLWPEKDQGKARHSLNEALRRLRKHLAAERLLSKGETITLNDDRLDVDARRVDALGAGEQDRAVALLRGDFLEGFTVVDAPAFEEWAAAQRERYRDRGATAYVSAGEAALQASRFPDAEDAGRRALGLRPYVERAARLLMRASALGGDAATALAVYRDFASRLEADLGEAPSRELAALAERIRAQRWRRQSSVTTEMEPPFVGRDAAQREAYACLAAGLSRGPQVLLIGGGPGSGKTRLLHTCGERLALDGAVLARARPLESDHDAPWSSLRQLVRGELLAAPGLSATPPEALGVLAALVPELAERVAKRDVTDRAAVADAVAACLRAVAEEVPVGLLIDDAHYADGATIAALASALGRLRALPVVAVLTMPPAAPDAARELARLAGDLGRGLKGAMVRLGPFDEQSLHELVEALAPWCPAGEQRDRLTRRIMFETNGIPLFAVTLLQGLARGSDLRTDALIWPAPRRTFEAPVPTGVSQLVRMTVTARIADLEPAARRVLAAAGVGGQAVDTDLVARLVELAEPELEEQLAVLERGHFLAFDGDRYAFVAPIVAQIVRSECYTPGQLKAARTRAIQALESRNDLESLVLRAELAAAADRGPATAALALAAARAAVAAGAQRSARRALEAAVRCGLSDAGTTDSIAEVRAQLDEVTVSG